MIKIMLVLPILSLALAAAKACPSPLIDRQLFFGDPAISRAQISPDGR